MVPRLERRVTGKKRNRDNESEGQMSCQISVRWNSVEQSRDDEKDLDFDMNTRLPSLTELVFPVIRILSDMNRTAELIASTDLIKKSTMQQRVTVALRNFRNFFVFLNPFNCPFKYRLQIIFSINFHRWIEIAIVWNLICVRVGITPSEYLLLAQSFQVLLAHEHLALKSRAEHTRLRRMKSFVIGEMKNSKRGSCRAGRENFFPVAHLSAESTANRRNSMWPPMSP